MSDHAKRLRNMAQGWQQTAEGTEKYGLPRDRERDIAHYRAQAAALLAGAEALERGESGWTASFEREHKGRTVTITEARPGRWYWYVDAFPDYSANLADTLEAAQAAAVAWVDEQEGRDA